MFLASHSVAMVTAYVMERKTMCSPIVGQLFDTISRLQPHMVSIPLAIHLLSTGTLPDHFRKTVDYSEFKRKLLVHSFS